MAPPHDAPSTLNPTALSPTTLHLNLSPFAACAPLTVRPDTPAPRVHALFVALSLRHLPVVDARGYLLGIITRKDLDHAAGRGWWRLTQVAPTPRHAPPPSASAHPLHHSDSWLSASLRSLTLPPRRLVEALHQRLSTSPAPAAALLAASGSSVSGGSPPDGSSPLGAAAAAGG